MPYSSTRPPPAMPPVPGNGTASIMTMSNSGVVALWGNEKRSGWIDTPVAGSNEKRRRVFFANTALTWST